MNTRRSIRLKEYDYSSNGYYFVTICTYEHRNLLGSVKNGKVELNPLGDIALEEWLNSKMIRKEISYDEYVIMPNHIHAIVIISNPQPPLKIDSSNKMKRPLAGCPAKSLSAFIAGFKSAVTTKARILSGSQLVIWQRNYYEHIIRNEKDLYRIQQYIQTNPAKWEHKHHSHHEEDIVKLL
ncbi:MAG: transposase [Ignavibacteria bacterium]|jgi:REP element-mobilizing transposase RayT|nr:transposase [Ignavibacteria bacterium]MCU7502200.1 transposase [Ignavibacteria bacterium]MCU7517417.1 transposase [Ignavibacteria bacterium]